MPIRTILERVKVTKGPARPHLYLEIQGNYQRLLSITLSVSAT